MKIVLYTKIKFLNKIIREYLQYIDDVCRVVTTPTSKSAKGFKSLYEAMLYVEKHNPSRFGMEVVEWNTN